jgi:hypothetical protein
MHSSSLFSIFTFLLLLSAGGLKAWFAGYITKVHRNADGKVESFDVDYDIPEEDMRAVENGDIDESLYWDVELKPRNVRLNEENPKLTQAMKDRRPKCKDKGKSASYSKLAS